MCENVRVGGGVCACGCAFVQCLITSPVAGIKYEQVRTLEKRNGFWKERKEAKQLRNSEMENL